MKRGIAITGLMLISILSLLLCCDMNYIRGEEENYYCKSPDMMDWGVLRIYRWCQDNIAGCSDQEQYGVTDYWATPAETLNSMKGDCEDFAILFLYLVHTYCGVDGKLVGIHYDWGPCSDHALAVVEGGIDTFPSVPYHVIRSYTYSQAIWIAIHVHFGTP